MHNVVTMCLQKSTDRLIDPKPLLLIYELVGSN